MQIYIRTYVHTLITGNVFLIVYANIYKPKFSYCCANKYDVVYKFTVVNKSKNKKRHNKNKNKRYWIIGGNITDILVHATTIKTLTCDCVIDNSFACK